MFAGINNFGCALAVSDDATSIDILSAAKDLSRLSLRPQRLCGKRPYLSQIFLRPSSVPSVLNLLTFSSG